MPIGGFYAGDADNVTDDGSINGWAQQGGYYGVQIGGRPAYCFGPVINNFGTWGQFIYDTPQNRGAPDLANPTGLNGVMPGGVAPDNSQWVQGHLVNGECGGAGNININLTPISHNINMLHRGWEAVLQRLANAGALANAMTISFNPNGLANCRLIYRTHSLPGPAGVLMGPPPHPFPNVPNGIVVSMGVVIGNVMKSAVEVANEFATPYSPASWFHQYFYGAPAASDRAKIISMIGGVEISYP